MKYIKFLGLSLIVLVSFKLIASAQVRAPVGKTTQQSSQLVFYYNDTDIGGPAPFFFSALHITNVSVDTPVWLHIQIFAVSYAFDANRVLVPSSCVHHDFTDFFTPQDTHLYIMDEDGLFKNDPFLFDTSIPDFFANDISGTPNSCALKVTASIPLLSKGPMIAMT